MSAEREIAAEDSIRVVCRFRPLNDSEEKAGSKFIVKFPNNQEENCISIAVSTKLCEMKIWRLRYFFRLFLLNFILTLFAFRVVSARCITCTSFHVGDDVNLYICTHIYKYLYTYMFFSCSFFCCCCGCYFLAHSFRVRRRVGTLRNSSVLLT